MRISERVRRIQPSATLAISARARALRLQGVDIVEFGAGEPDFDTPPHIKDAASQAMARGATKYTAVSGIADLRKAAAEELSRAHGVAYTAEEVVVSTGAKHSLYNAFMALLDDGDEVIVPAPCWVSHTEIVRMAGGVPVLLLQRAEDDFRLDVAALARLITPKTRAILLASPTNPTGAVYDPEAVAEVGRLVLRLQRPDLCIVTDDLYRRMVYGGARWSSVLHSAPDLRGQVVLVDGVSKSYAMTGWRIGLCAAPRELVAAMDTLQGQMTTNAATLSQHAALAALTGEQSTVEEMVGEFDRRRRVMYQALTSMPGVVCNEPLGAFYCFPDMRRYLSPAAPGAVPVTDAELAEWLLVHARIAVVPGSGFYGPGHIRFSYATSMESIELGMERLRQGLAEFQRRGGTA